MNIAIDFDGTVVEQNRPYDDVSGEFDLMPGALEALKALKEAGHVLFLWSARSAFHLRRDWRMNPLWIARPDLLDLPRWNKSKELNEARYQAMLKYVTTGPLKGVFDAVDTGMSGKPSVDLFIDDKARQLGGSGLNWSDVADTYGEEADAEATE